MLNIIMHFVWVTQVGIGTRAVWRVCDLHFAVRRGGDGRVAAAVRAAVCPRLDFQMSHYDVNNNEEKKKKSANLR